VKKSDRVADAEQRLGAVLRCKFCPFTTPKWRQNEGKRRHGWLALETHVRLNHFDKWRPISEVSLKALFAMHEQHGSVIDEFDRYLQRTAETSSSGQSADNKACRAWRRHRRDRYAPGNYENLSRRWIDDAGQSLRRLEGLWVRFHTDVIAAEDPARARYEEGTR